MIDPAVLPGFLTSVALVTIAPGPDNTYIAAVAIQRGVASGLRSAAGMAIGMTVHVTAAALGLATVLRASPGALDAIRLLGAAYLLWLAFDTVRAIRASAVGDRDVPEGQVLRRAVLVNLTNPKIILFFAAFLPHFLREDAGPAWLQFLVLGLLFLVVGLVCDSLVGLTAGKLRQLLAPGSHAATVLNLVTALTFAVLAGLLVNDVVRG
jgi:threonine/homoserine/homoserine lactone efflux protein